MSRNLLKGGYVIVAQNEKIKIDSNETIARKLEALAKAAPAPETAAEPVEGFVEGIDPVQVAQLTSEYQPGEDVQAQDANAGSNLIRPQTLKAEQELLEDARKEAEQILAEAREQAETIRATAREDGYQAGHDSAAAEAEQENERLRSRLTEEYETRSRQLEEEYRNKKQELEPALIDTLTEIYSHVLGITLPDEIKLVPVLLQKTLEGMDSSSHYIIHVSREDVAQVRDAKEMLSSASGIPSANMEVVEDNTVGKGGCMIESDFGIFDCGLDTQLCLLRRQLCLLSYQKDDEE